MTVCLAVGSASCSLASDSIFESVITTVLVLKWHEESEE